MNIKIIFVRRAGLQRVGLRERLDLFHQLKCCYDL